MSINFTADAAGDDGHKQRMDSMYRVQRHFYDLTRAYYLLGRNQRIADLNPPSGGSVLEVGCGTGRNLVALARRYPQARIYGFDISDEMLTSAAHAIERHGLRQQIQLAQGDATVFNGSAFGKTQFDRVLFSYTLSMIPDWQRALGNAAQMLSPDGELHVVDFGPCSGLPGFIKAALYSWLRRFHVTPRTDLSVTAENLARERRQRADCFLSHRGYAQHLVLRQTLAVS